ncbi:MAG: hypothetical protein FD146_416 [Anaerolineaceae bacterium]|nr:MAG: hypothetical protein FD146_416 [Anaerolineaceae bacterium]
MRVLMTGGTGLIGTALTQSLLADGHSVWALTRRDPGPALRLRSGQALATGNLTLVRWDGRTPSGWGGLVSETDAVVNLAGESLSKWPWTEKQKARFWQSRVDAGRALVEAIRSASPRPQALIQISGINHYGMHGEPADESTPPGGDFLARLTVAWEDATKEVESLGVRRCVVRLGVVLAKRGSLFPLMALPVRMFAGGPIGSGKQAVPWVHLDDVTGALRFLLENEQASGAYNLIAPEPVSNADFYKALAKALGRPYWLPAPAFLLRLALGGMSVLVVDGRYAQPKRLLEAGYRFQVEGMGEAMKRLVG